MAQNQTPNNINNDNQSPSSRSIRVSVIGYSFSLFAFVIFVYIFLYPVDKELKQQAIYWFYTSLIAALVPNIKEFKLKEFEIEFREEIVKEIGAKIEEKTEELKLNVLRAFEESLALEDLLPEDYRRIRDDRYREYVIGLEQMTLEEQLDYRKEHTLEFLKSRNLSISDFKQMLKKIGCYEGKIDDDFNEELVNCILKFQQQYKIDPMGGIVGPKTFNKMAMIITERG